MSGHRDGIKVYNEDYKETVKRLKRQKIKVDAIITDPPYGVSRTNQLGYSNMGRNGMNYGEWDYNFDQKKWIRICASLVKPGGSFIIFNDWKNFTILCEQLIKYDFIIKDIIRWEKKNPMPRNVDRRYVNDCEFAIWAVKSGKPWTFNKPKNKSYLKPLYKTGVVAGGKSRLHPTQKHLVLMESIIKVHTNVNDLIFDPFLGSGTTALACKNTKRNCVGSEIDDKYFSCSMERLK